jgi:hypothetical protein
MVSIVGLDKADVLLALYNASFSQGISFTTLPAKGPTREDAEAATADGDLRFDYWNGHVLKVDLSGDEFDPWLFDRDCGSGAAEAAVSALR